MFWCQLRSLLLMLAVFAGTQSVVLAANPTKQTEQNAGYVLLCPQVPTSRNASDFVVSFISGEAPTIDVLMKRVSRCDSRVMSNWLGVNRLNGDVVFVIHNQVSPLNSLLSILHVGHQVSVKTADCSDTFIAGAWQSTESEKYGLYAIKKDATNATYENLIVKSPQGTAVFESPGQSGDIFQFVAWGRYATTLPYGYPFAQWTPRDRELKVHNLHQRIASPKLAVPPPDSLINSRQKSQWQICGDLRKSFALYTNPTHAESVKGLKTRALIYLQSLKKWETLDLDGTECYPMYFGHWMVFQIAQMDPKSRPEERFGYPPKATGQFVIVHLTDGKTYTIQLDANSSVLHVDTTSVLIREKSKLLLLPLASIGTEEEDKSREVLCEDPLVQSVQYALPVERRPSVVLPEDSEWTIPDKSSSNKKKTEEDKMETSDADDAGELKADKPMEPAGKP